MVGRRRVAVGVGAVLAIAAGIAFGVLAVQSSSDRDDRIVRRYGEAIGATDNELDMIRQEALNLAHEICATVPENFVEQWDATSIGADAALAIAEIRCPRLAREFAEDDYSEG